MVDSTEGTKEGSGQTETLHDKSQPSIQFAQKSPSLAWPITKDVSSSGMLSRIKMVWNNWTYGFMNRILKKGSQQFQHGEHLGIDDLYEVPDEMRADVLVQRFRKLYAEKKSLPKALFSLIIPVFMPAGFWELIYLCTRLSMPISLRYLLQALEENPLQSVVDENGLYFVFTLSAATLLGVLAQNRTQYLSTKSGIIMRAALTCAIYDHALKLSPTGKLGLSSGEITNLVATDTQKLYDVVIEGHNGWSCPVCICVVTVLLVVTIGPELLVGVLVLVLFLPVVQAIVTRMLSLRRERSKLTDVRINILTSMLQGIRVTKLNHYESKVEESVNRIREQEMGLLRKELSMWGWVLTSAVCSPILAVAVSFTTYVLVDQSNILTPSRTFSALLLFSVLRFPINLASRLVGKAAQAIEASNRITNFLSRDITEHSLDASTSVHSNLGRNAILKVKNQSFVIRSTETQIEDLNVTTHSTRSRSAKNDHDSNAHEETESSMAVSTFKLQQLNFEICYGELMAVVGSVGSGKSLLLRALLGEIPSLDGEEVKINGTVGFASQQAFIINASLRENILFGSKWDEQKYERVVQACSLHYDIDRLEPAGDLTQIGERGVTLSGGQKQRVALARVVYAEPSLALLDDCFSALDANTASMVFSSLFGDGESEGVMSDCGTVLVTHAIQFLPRVDKILVMSNGSPSFIGTWKDLQTQKGERDATIASIQNYGRKDGSNSNKKRHTHRRDDLKEVDGLIMSVEERQYGLSSLKVWSKWFSAAGGLPFVVGQVLFLILDRGFYVASDWWLSIWSDSADKTTTVLGYTFAPQRDGFEAQRDFVIVYAIIIVCSVTATIIRSQWSVAGGARCAHKLFKLMTHSALRAKMSYFDTTPLGRILNRFTYDVEVLDIELSVSMVGLMISASWLISSVVVMIVIVPYMALGLLPVIVLYFYMQLYYRMSGPDLQRIDAVSRSPIQATLAEGLEGSTTIRAFRKETNFSQNFRKCVDNNSSAMMNFLAAERWLGLRIECLGALITFVISLLIVCGNSQLRIDPGKVGLVIQWAVVFTTALNFFFLRMSESEARITSIERINETSNLPQESDWKTRNTKLSPSWPERGELEFVDVSMRYRPGLPLALNGVSFKLPAGTRCGVVGRTGSGKTSLTASILRLVEIEAGQILLDGVDLGKIGLSDVRGRRNGIRIIPQDPVLFAGTLRDCLDPFQQSNDEMIFNALRAVNHAGSEDRGFSILNDRVEEGGANFSVGERQLLCLARAIIEEPRVLILDEATASVDTGTDTFIQNMLRQKFHHTTLLTIAHRLHTVMDYDKVLVLSDGRCIDFGSPSELLDNPDGAFTAFVDSTGPENAAELRKIAYSSGSGVDELE